MAKKRNDKQITMIKIQNSKPFSDLGFICNLDIAICNLLKSGGNYEP